MSENNKNADSNFVNYLKDLVINDNTIRFMIIGFFITINLAIYGGLYKSLSDNKDIPYYLILLLLSLLQLFFNVMIFRIYIREHNIIKIRLKFIEDYYKKNTSDLYSKYNGVLKLDKMKGVTFRSIKWIFFVVIIVNIVISCYLLYKIPLFSSNFNCCCGFVIALIFGFVLCFLSWLSSNFNLMVNEKELEEKTKQIFPATNNGRTASDKNNAESKQP